MAKTRRFKCPAPGCDEQFAQASQRRLHVISRHVGDDDLMALARKEEGMAHEDSPETTSPDHEPKRAETDMAATVQHGFEHIEQTLANLGGKVEDLCQQHPELCRRVESMEQALGGRGAQYGTDDWRQARERDLAHALFDDCPECAPIRDRVLSSRGKRLTDTEPPQQAQDEAAAPMAEAAEVEEPELERSPGYKPGYRWDDDEGCYVRRR